MRLKRRDGIAIILAPLALLAGYLILSLVSASFALAVTLTLVFTVLFYLGVRIYRQALQVSEQQSRDYRQVEALFSLFNTLRIQRPLDPMRGWAVSPDFAKTLAGLVLRHRPECILELGSGISTIVGAYGLKTLGRGKLVSLEHSEEFSSITAKNLEDHGLSDHARVIFAPLEDTPCGGRTWKWYDTGRIPDDLRVDMLVVDGPPQHLHPIARYPALPLLMDRLSDHAVIVVDDAVDESMRQVVALWRKEFDLDYRYIDAEEGIVVLNRK